jgi:hypothetical protein
MTSEEVLFRYAGRLALQEQAKIDAAKARDEIEHLRARRPRRAALRAMN